MNSYELKAYNKAKEGIYISDVETYELLYLNPKLVEMLGGRSAADFLGKRCHEIVPGCAAPCASCCIPKLSYDKFYEWTFYQPQLKHLCHFYNKLINFQGRKAQVCICKFVDDEVAQDDAQRPFYDKSVVNEALRMAMYEPNPQKALSILIEYLGSAFQCDRAYLAELDGATLHPTYEWYRYGATPLADDQKYIQVSRIERIFPGFTHGKIAIINDIEEMREQNYLLYEYFRQRNISSFIACPMRRNGAFCGFIGFNNVRVNIEQEIRPTIYTAARFASSLLSNRDLLVQLEYTSHTDLLTGLGNRYALEKRFAELPKDTSLGVVFSDVCGLKNVNDVEGHHAGDSMILRATDVLCEIFGKEKVFRYAGDELIVLDDGVSESELQTKVELARQKSRLHNAPLALGVIWKKTNSDGLEYLLIEADKRMSADKNAYYAGLAPDDKVINITGEQKDELAFLPLDFLMENSPQPMLLFRPEENLPIVFANRKVWELYDCESEEDFTAFCNGSVLGTYAADVRETLRNNILTAKDNGIQKEHRVIYPVETKLGNRFEVIDRGGVIDVPGYGNVVLCTLAKNINADALTETNDRLTGMLGMKRFVELTTEILQQVPEEEQAHNYSVAYCNICNLKYYNVRHGSQAGDEVLRSLAERIKIAEGQLLTTRVSGDHFISLAKADLGTLMREVNKIVNEFNNKYTSVGMKLKIGIYHFASSEKDIAKVCDLAKMACDSVRNSNQNFCLYNEKMDHYIEVESYVLQSIDDAIANNYLQVYYQPVMRTLDSTCCSFEALARWIDPVYGFMSPADFVPVLEKHRLITKLDLQILRLVCQEMLEAERRGYLTIPVSINLSRYDFEECDIVAAVDEIVLENGIARDMINIEVTESAVMENPELLYEEIKRFRELGYEVWMDDFGSGYSSLNTLRKYEFDEIKLDMGFMRTFDEKAKEIVKAVIGMAKNLQIHTLTEGVETQEQLDFLREIGCEKVQGYYFSAPISYARLLEMVDEKQFTVEPRKWRKYYDAMSKVNFLTDKSLALLEYDGKDFSYYYINDEFRKVWKSLGVTDVNIVCHNMNSPQSPLSRQFRELHDRLRLSKGEQEMVYSVRGQYVNLWVKYLANEGERYAYQAEITNLSVGEEKEKRERLDNIFRMIYTLYDSIFLLDFKKGTFEFVNQINGYNIPELEELYKDKHLQLELAAETMIHPGDREEYLAFFDKKTVLERLQASPYGYLTKFFRTKAERGAYLWKGHTMLYVADVDKVIYFTRRVQFKQNSLFEKLMPEYLATTYNKADDAYHRALRQGVHESQTLNLFWKDKNRRFVGANQHFLDTYGFADVSAIIGKTDEDMGWHLDNIPFREDELRVLQLGEVQRNRIGSCVIKGVTHNIMASKEPIYDENGEIVGLLGYFIDIDNVKETFDGGNSNVSQLDKLTGLLSLQGLMDVLTQYLENRVLHNENFVLIKISINEYGRSIRSYGESTARKMLGEIGQLIKETVGINGTCARLHTGHFVVVAKYRDEEMLNKLVSELRSELRAVHMLAGYAETLNPQISVQYTDAIFDIQELINAASN